jgi:hypothetical protein
VSPRDQAARLRPPATRAGDPLSALSGLAPETQLAVALQRLAGGRRGLLAAFQVASELAPRPGRIDGRLLEEIVDRALGGARGAVFTPDAEARILAAFGLAHAAAGRGGPPAGDAVALLMAGTDGPQRTRRTGRTGPERAAVSQLRAALDGLAVLDPACGGGALLVAAERLARGVGARLRLLGLDLAPLAARAARARLELLGATVEVRAADALTAAWPRADLILANPPFLRHEAIPAAAKAAAARSSGLSRQADLSAHLALLALRRAPVAALVLPRALFSSRSAEPLQAEARARGGFTLRLRSRAAGSFAASVDTLLAVWVEGGTEAPAAEAEVGLEALSDAALAALARGRSSPGLRTARGEGRAQRAHPDAVRLDTVCQVRFGVKSGCNGFFHLRSLGPGRYRSPLLGEVELAASDVTPLLASLKEARAPERLEPALVLFRPAGRPSQAARRYLDAGVRAGVDQRPSCAGRAPWWRLAPGRLPAPLLYPAKIGARAFAVVNDAGLFEDKKWHALFPRGAPAWPLALALSSTPVRLAVDEGARQLTGAQAIADVDCRVLAAALVPTAAALERAAGPLSELRAALALDEVTTDLAAMLERPAQRELDLLVGRLLGLGAAAVGRARRALVQRVADRLEHAAAVRARIAGRGPEEP